MSADATAARRKAFFDHVDANVESYISRLAEAVAIRSVSAEPARRPDCIAMVEHFRAKMGELGISSELRDLGTHTVDGTEVPLPPVIVGRLGDDKSKRTVCVYGHLDVQPAPDGKADGWDTDPWVLTRVECDAEADAKSGYGAFPSGGKLYGRGSTDDKGPALSWLFVVEAYQKLGLELPVNLLFLVECMEESGSVGLDDVVKAEFADGGYLAAAEALCVADNYWASVSKPAVQYGLRGIVFCFVEIKGPAKDLHSGKYGGVVHEPMIDLVRLMASLADSHGNILVPGVMDTVAKLTDAEAALYDGVEVSADAIRSAAGAPKLIHEGDKARTLMHMWRYPTLTLHGIEGAHAEPGAKTVIPAKVVGKFSLRLVPDQEPAAIEALVRKHCEDTFAAFGTPNSMRMWTEHGAKAFGGDPFDDNYQAAKRANEVVYGVTPDFVRSGGSIPVTLTMQETGRSVVLFPIGRADDGAHSQNEKVDVNNFINGIKLEGTYLEEFAAGGSGAAGAGRAGSST